MRTARHKHIKTHHFVALILMQLAVTGCSDKNPPSERTASFQREGKERVVAASSHPPERTQIDDGPTSKSPTDQDSPVATASPGAESPGITGAAVRQLPLDAYVTSFEQLEAIDRAQAVLAAKCMKQKGFSYIATPPLQKPAPRRQPYGLEDIQQAKSLGYHRPTATFGGGTLVNEKAPEAYTLALYGSFDESRPRSGGGCAGEAQAQLNPSDKKVSELVGQLGQLAAARTAADPRVLAADTAWVSCMAAKGYQYSNTMEPQSAPWPSTLSQREIDTAVADVVCKLEVALPRIWHETEATQQSSLVEKHLSDLAEAKQSLAERLRVAQAVLSAAS